jgi:uncharacterized hydrophobic protein (TIGR00271 family)
MNSIHAVSNWAIRQPLAWAASVMGVSALIAITGQSTSDPTRSLAFAFLGSGLSVSIAALAFLQWRLLAVGGGLILWGGGALAASDVMIYGVIPAIVLAGMAIVALFAWERRHVAVATALVCVAVLMAFFELDLMLLLTGVSTFVATTGLIIGLDQARREGVTERLSPSEVMRHLRTWRDGRVDLAEDVELLHRKLLFEGLDARRRIARFLVLMGFASAIASLGVISDSTAVVIGAMLIAPLMTPLMATSLSLAMAWPSRLVRSLTLAGSGAALAIGTGVLVSAIAGLGTDVATNAQIASRVTPTLLDLGIALAAGAAGAYALSRSDVSDSLPGVAVAIALVPPLTVVGVAAQLGEWEASLGALILFATNALAIFGMGALTFVLTGAAASHRRSGGHHVIQTVMIVIVVSSMVVLGALLANGQSLSSIGYRQDRAEALVGDWIGDRDYDFGSVKVDDGTVVVRISAAQMPDDAEALAQAMSTAFEEDVSLDLRVTRQESLATSARFDGD